MTDFVNSKWQPTLLSKTAAKVSCHFEPDCKIDCNFVQKGDIFLFYFKNHIYLKDSLRWVWLYLTVHIGSLVI